MTNSDKNYITGKELIELLINNEKGSQAFYKKIMGKANDEDSIEFVNILIKDCEKRINTLLNFKINIEKSKIIIQFSPEFSYQIPKLEKNNPILHDFLCDAMVRVHKLAETLSNTAEHSSGESKRILDGLIIFQKEYKERLENLQTYYIDGEGKCDL